MKGPYGQGGAALTSRARRLLAIALQSTEVIAAAAFFAVVTVFLLLFAGGLGRSRLDRGHDRRRRPLAVSALVIASCTIPIMPRASQGGGWRMTCASPTIAAPEIRALIAAADLHRAAMESQRYAARAHAGTVEGVTRAADRWLQASRGWRRCCRRCRMTGGMLRRGVSPWFRALRI